ncbi:hypothetical protein TREMEDRAFT_64687 [Tremella mesenterica DSM 1558]|uniref:uncharacterized protein n=1 Tax=Tremella mesenterica (strain ATCC 24925 / CBS 8224 / DSM 1558 / NBRC 9311 / NRRL Y-6157 / RJB 2259-6 / UBC 559-6) TaxID=578456 RepID=UPI0003F49213|nr:uncharacterized protein TREMEDRAFT_64687 [Tremella mesenterica DSM 1558]EIW67431.1 hypothetical protein TREMEDRAFT_64687 [Tremella mesenterica DSM 1558]
MFNVNSKRSYVPLPSSFASTSSFPNQSILPLIQITEKPDPESDPPLLTEERPQWLRWILNFLRQIKTSISRISPRIRLLLFSMIIFSIILSSQHRISSSKIGLRPSKPTSYSGSSTSSSSSSMLGIENESEVKEAYVTFLSPGDDNYFTSVRLIVFALLHDPITLDPATSSCPPLPSSSISSATTAISENSLTSDDKIELAPIPRSSTSNSEVDMSRRRYIPELDPTSHSAPLEPPTKRSWWPFSSSSSHQPKCGPRRDIVVLTSPNVPKHQISTLQNEGAIIIPSQDLEKGSIEHMPEHWKHALTKLAVFNMTQYDRLLLLDGDIFLNLDLRGVWEDEHSWPKSGLAATGDGGAGFGGWHEVPQSNEGDFNSGFMIVIPNRTTFEELLKVEDYDHGWADQRNTGEGMGRGLLNVYFHPEGPHPWEQLDHKWVGNYPGVRELEYGINALHEKLWRGSDRNDLPEELRSLWERRVGRMEGYWLSHRPIGL